MGNITNFDVDEMIYDLKDSKARQEIAVERGRIDNLAQAPEGSTTGDLELIDLRYGDDGVTYVDAGTAVRTQFANVKSDLNDLDDRVEALEEGGGGGSGLTADLKAALDQLAQKVAYIDEDGQDYYDALHSALYPPADLVSISAVYTQSGTVYDTDTLDSLKSDLVVTAHFSDSTTQTVTTYTLSGTLTEGTSTITVSYGGKTTTFDVVVSHQAQVVKTYFSDVQTLTTGYLKKTNGSDQALGGGSYVELDYVDGMYIHSRMNSTWGPYLNIVLYNGSTYSSVPMTKTGSESYPTYENTLSGYTGITKVYVNCATLNIDDCYYEVEV